VASITPVETIANTTAGETLPACGLNLLNCAISTRTPWSLYLSKRTLSVGISARQSDIAVEQIPKPNRVPSPNGLAWLGQGVDLTNRSKLQPALFSLPIIGAPLAGGPTTPALAAAVSEAGGLGFLAAGYETATELADDMASLRGLTQHPFGVNLFYPVREQIDETKVAAYVDSLASEAERYGVAAGRPQWSDDDWLGKLELVRRQRPAVVSFTFGCPNRETVEELRSAEISVWCTVTSPGEAEQAASAGVDALVVQGAEAGGHQGSFSDRAEDPFAVLALLQLVCRTTDLPLIATGGIATAQAIAAVLAAGASAAQLGTALLLTPEAGTSEPHRHALRGDRPTKLTRAFTGRRARGIVNRFMVEHEEAAPLGYPEIHYVTGPIRAAARARGDAEGTNLWAGQAYQLARERPASELVEDLAGELAKLGR
jgi:nitronate monooxygenase